MHLSGCAKLQARWIFPPGPSVSATIRVKHLPAVFVSAGRCSLLSCIIILCLQIRTTCVWRRLTAALPLTGLENALPKPSLASVIHTQVSVKVCFVRSIVKTCSRHICCADSCATGYYCAVPDGASSGECKSQIAKGSSCPNTGERQTVVLQH